VVAGMSYLGGFQRQLHKKHGVEIAWKGNCTVSVTFLKDRLKMLIKFESDC